MATMLEQAKAKVLQQRRLGTGTLKITHFKVGDATYYEPESSQTDLVQPCLIGSSYTKAITSVVLVGNELTYTCTLSEEECAGKNITEFGLVDEDGNVVCIKTFPAKIKTSEREMVINIKDRYEEDE